MIYLFLDTNIYLHCQDFEHLPWDTILSTNEEICIVVPPVTISEVDKIKDQGTGKVNRRARKISEKFGDIFLENKGGKLTVVSCDEPTSSDYESSDLDRGVADDRFILSALLFAKAGADNVVVIARDNIALIKAKNKGLQIVRIPEKYHLKEELSKEEKELIEVKKQLAQYTSRISDPCLTFDNGEVFIKIKKPVITDTESVIAIAIQEERENITYFQNASDLPNTLSHIAIMTSASAGPIWKILKPTQEQIELHDKEVDEYHQEFEEYIRLKVNRDVLLAQMCEIKFTLRNQGNAPTGDLEIFMYFPDNVRIYDRRSQKHIDIDNPPVLPGRPSAASCLLDRTMRKQLQGMERNSFTPHPLGGVIDNRPKIWDLSKMVKKHQYHFSKKPLAQTLQCSVNFEYGMYVDLLQCGNFSIGYTVVDTSLPKPIDGLLNFIVD